MEHAPSLPRPYYRLSEYYNVAPHIAEIAADETGLSDTLRSLGLEPRAVKKAWTDYGYGQGTMPDGTPDSSVLSVEQYTAHSLRTVLELEKRLPGSVQQISSRHDLFSFGRHTVDYLAKLYQTEPYLYDNVVLGACASGCYNGAVWDGAIALERLDELLPDNTAVMIDEVYSSEELVKRWTRYFDLGVRACYFIICGHGNSQEIETVLNLGGRSGYRGTLTKKDVRGKVGDLIKALAAPGAAVLLDACSTGAGEDNLALALHEHTGLPVTAPVADVELQSLTGVWRNGVLRVTPGFYKPIPQGSKYIHRRSAARHYR